jgi:hypothetical protein
MQHGWSAALNRGGVCAVPFFLHPVGELYDPAKISVTEVP